MKTCAYLNQLNEQNLHRNNHTEKIHNFTNRCLSFKMLCEARIQKNGGIPKSTQIRNNSKPHQSTKTNNPKNEHTHARIEKQSVQILPSEEIEVDWRLSDNLSASFAPASENRQKQEKGHQKAARFKLQSSITLKAGLI